MYIEKVLSYFLRYPHLPPWAASIPYSSTEETRKGSYYAPKDGQLILTQEGGIVTRNLWIPKISKITKNPSSHRILGLIRPLWPLCRGWLEGVPFCVDITSPVSIRELLRSCTLLPKSSSIFFSRIGGCHLFVDENLFGCVFPRSRKKGLKGIKLASCGLALSSPQFLAIWASWVRICRIQNVFHG